MKILDDQKATKRNASSRAVSLADEFDQLAMTAWPRINYATWARRLRALAMKVCRQEADLRMARAELDARAEVITGLQAALVEMRERQRSDTDESSTGYAHLDMIVTAHNRGHVSQRMIDDAAAWLDENERMPEPTP